MKPGKTFKLSKTVKRMLGLMGGSAESRNQYKRMMIDAELAASIVVKPAKKESRPGGAYNSTSHSATAAD